MMFSGCTWEEEVFGKYIWRRGMIGYKEKERHRVREGRKRGNARA